VENEKDKEKEREEKAILAKLALLARIRKLHEWTVVGPREVEEEEEAETKIDSGASDLTTDLPEGE
jgi:hypothetical protein